eukprot:7845549-Pyramimonas_sp.AAC.1
MARNSDSGTRRRIVIMSRVEVSSMRELRGSLERELPPYGVIPELHAVAGPDAAQGHHHRLRHG